MAVTKETKETIMITIDEVFKKMNSISWIERQKVMKEEAFKNTEKILYCYNALREHVADEKAYIEEGLEAAGRGKSKSVVVWSKTPAAHMDEEQIIESRTASYKRSCADLKKVEKALKHIKDKKGYEVIEMRYLKRKDGSEIYTYEEIAEALAGKGAYGDNLNEKTVRGYKTKLVKEIAVLLFGSDAI